MGEELSLLVLSPDYRSAIGFIAILLLLTLVILAYVDAFARIVRARM